MNAWQPGHVAAWCGSCGWGVRVEVPTPTETSMVVRQAKRHATLPGHSTAVERGSSRAFDAPPLGDEQQ